MNRAITKLSLWPSVAIVLGCIIGSGIFVKSSDVIAIAGNTSYAIISWCIGGMIALCSGLTLAEVAFRYPKTGGVYVYIECIYGKTLGFLAGWVQAFVFAPTFFAALNLYFSEIFCTYFGLEASWKIPVAIVCLFTLAIINSISVKYASLLQDISALVKIIPLLVLGLGGLFLGKYPFWNVQLASVPVFDAMSLISSFSSTILFTLWAYEGWVNISYVTEEIENPSRNIPLAISIGVILSMSIYIIYTVALIKTVGADNFATMKDQSVSAAALTLFGPFFALCITPIILVSIFGTINGQTMTTTRISYAMAKSDLFPLRKYFSQLHPKFMTPAFSIGVNSILATVMICLSKPSRIADISMIIIYMIYGLAFLGIFKVRKLFGKPEKGKYCIPFYPLTPLIAIFGCLFICINVLKDRPMDMLIAFVLSLIGLPVYLYLKRKDRIKVYVQNNSNSNPK